MSETPGSTADGSRGGAPAAQSVLFPSRGDRYSDAYWLPYPMPVPPPPAVMPHPGINPGWMGESCVGRAIIGAIGGGGIGIVMGIFLGAMGDLNPPIFYVKGREAPQAPLAEQARLAYRQTAERSVGWSKSFFALTALFAGSECVIEKFRGRHDGWNPVLSGCAAGAMMSASQGPAAACMGCAGFAAFSAAIEAIMH